MYVGYEYSATANASRLALFECGRCGCRARVVAKASAKGSAHAPFFLGREGAAQAARSRAVVAAREEAARLARLARCPECRARRTSAVLLTALRQSVHLLWLVPVGCCVSLIVVTSILRAAHTMLSRDGGSELRAAFGLGLLAAVAGVGLLTRRKLSRADSGVEFVEVRRSGAQENGATTQ